MGVDVALLPQLAAEIDPVERRKKVIIKFCQPLWTLSKQLHFSDDDEQLPSQTTQHLQSYDKIGRKLFAQTVRIVLEGIETRYKDVSFFGIGIVLCISFLFYLRSFLYSESGKTFFILWLTFYFLICVHFWCADWSGSDYEHERNSNSCGRVYCQCLNWL